MRTLAKYSLEAVAGAAMADLHLANRVRSCIDKWICAKGELRHTDSSSTLRLRDGRQADVSCYEVSTPQGSLYELTVDEPTDGGTFKTVLAVAHDPGRVSVLCELLAGSQELRPLWVDVHCPRVIRDILAIDGSSWTYRSTHLTHVPRTFLGTGGGDAFIELVQDAARAVPVVAVSEDFGLQLHPGVTAALASDLAGIAVVAQLDSDASWRVTSMLGKHWSCYGGAIRLYWPGVRNGAEPLDHPLWTPQRLLSGLIDTESAAHRIRSQLRRHILGQSAFGVSPPSLFAAIRQAAREEEINALHSRIQQGDNHRSMAEEFLTKIVELSKSLESREQELGQLRAEVANLQVALSWRNQTEDLVAPVEEAPPATVEDAVLTAMDRFSDTLVFGEDVSRGIHTLAPDAGPPDKILRYLSAVSEMAQVRRKGPLGTSEIRWFADRNVTASGETPQVRRSSTAMQARTWGDGFGRRRSFDLHLKPTDGTSPDRCVRIYVDYDEGSGRSIIAWVGRHP